MNSRKVVDCAFCNREQLSKDEVALNKKLIHRQVERMMCLVCMALYFETTEEDLKEKISEFKYQGCALFS